MERLLPSTTRTDTLFPYTMLFRSLHRLEIGRVRVRQHVAFAGLQLLIAHAGIRRDGEDQVVDRGLAFPVVRVRLVADHRVLLVGDELERPGADRLEVDLLRRAGFHHLVGVLRSEEHTSELQSLMRLSYAVFCLKK